MGDKPYAYYVGRKYDGMMGRCYRKKDISFKLYGGKNIRVCSEWIKNIDNFREWFDKEIKKITTIEHFCKNSAKLQLDRIDPSGHYTPDNCRIITAQQNSRNKIKKTLKEVISAEGDVIVI